MDVTLEPGEGHAFHRHDGQEEMIIVKQGAITQYIERESDDARPRATPSTSTRASCTPRTTTATRRRTCRS